MKKLNLVMRWQWRVERGRPIRLGQLAAGDEVGAAMQREVKRKVTKQAWH